METKADSPATPTPAAEAAKEATGTVAAANSNTAQATATSAGTSAASAAGAVSSSSAQATSTASNNSSSSNAGVATGAATVSTIAASSTQQPPPAKKPNPSQATRSDPSALPTRQYLDQTVAPVLLHGLQALARERPTDPIQFLASYLLKHSNGCEEPVANDASTTSI
ncbi:protein dpy-30 homolog [Drosophila grimshawi]|uniref:GH10427 n=1 Tax=Drosophila grimshawi TaxID=7222 RepID=B4JE55_DROGR|nr:protein dpy-30 homolog [Drosophila grimshawi]EDW03575.1 GH10427 [Drosophila grimshawi]